MLLETLDTKHNDIVIYSQNIFNLETNFKIIFKDEKIKKPHSINYYEVCNYMNEPSPKVVVAYRLLTNLHNFNLRKSQYGFPIFVGVNPDLIFFDPIFAVQELESLGGVIDLQRLRFRIQQIGLNSIVSRGDKPGFTEIYSFDLSSKEALTQNDKIFADAIFALDENFIDSEDKAVIKTKTPEEKNNIKIDVEYNVKDFERFVQSEKSKTQNTPNLPKTGFGNFLDQNRMKEKEEIRHRPTPQKKNSMINVFKSTGQFNEYLGSKNEGPVILKFNK